MTLEALSQGLVFTIDETTFPVTGHPFRHTLSLSLQPPFDTGLRLREIYLEPESPFQAPAGHIPGPGGIKLGSPAPISRPNHLIINTGRFQVNFTKAGIKTQRPATHLSATHLSATHHLQLITCNTTPSLDSLPSWHCSGRRAPPVGRALLRGAIDLTRA